GNSSTLTLTASATATLGNATVTIGGSNATVGARSVQLALTVGSGGGGGGSATISGAVASNSPWFIEEQVRLANPAPITAMTVTISIARNPAGLSVSGQYNTLGGTVTQSSSTSSSQLTYIWTL